MAQNIRHNAFYINGKFCDPLKVGATFPVVNPSTEEVLYDLPLGTSGDVDAAVAAARAAFPKYSVTTVAERKELFRRIIEVFTRRVPDMGKAISDEMGAPLDFACNVQTVFGLMHLKTLLEELDTYPFEERRGTALVLREPIGVCALITPWNWPMNQICLKVGAALAVGCTMVLKPSEFTPGSAVLFADILHEAGVPPGVFNLVHGLGPEVGAALSSHPHVDMVSFTGSTRAGVDVAIRAAPTVKRVSQELGGKSANILVDDAGFADAVKRGTLHCFGNCGQSCNAPTRMLVPRARMEEAAKLAAEAAATARLGPLVNANQFNRVQQLIQKGIDEGAKLSAGGVGRPEGVAKGYFVRPTVFYGVNNQMTVAREEIFGPVLSIIPYDSIDEAVDIANDSPYGLAGYVQAKSPTVARALSKRLRVGNVAINGADADLRGSFGGYKQSGNGREWGAFGMDDFCEIKSVVEEF